jgi:RNA polymerase sigma-70 factor (ECF subfamily)
MRQAIDGADSFDGSSDTKAVDVLVQRCLPAVQRWAHGKLPRAARGEFDTKDLVQEAAFRMLKRGGRFAPRHSQAVHAYMRQTVLNLIRDQARRFARRGEPVELAEEVACDRTGPLELAVRQELRAHYEDAMRSLRTKERELLIARVEHEHKAKDIARLFGLPSPDAARMAVGRAFHRLMGKLNHVR